MVSSSSASRSRPWVRAVSSRRRYSGLVSSRLSSRNSRPLDAQGFHPKRRPAQKYKEPVDRRQLDVDGGRRPASPPARPAFQAPAARLGRRPAVQPGGKSRRIPQVFLNGGGALFLPHQALPERLELFSCDGIVLHCISPPVQLSSIFYLPAGCLCIQWILRGRTLL